MQVVVDFYADWCGPCKRIAPDIEQLSEKNQTVIFLKVNVDTEEEIASKYDVSSMPTFMFFKDGNKVGEVIGANLKAITQKIEDLNK